MKDITNLNICIDRGLKKRIADISDKKGLPMSYWVRQTLEARLAVEDRNLAKKEAKQANAV